MSLLTPDHRRKTSVAASTLALAALLCRPAWAAFSSTTPGTAATVTSGTLLAPTALTATCATLSSNVNLAWTATISTIATGYRVLRSTTSGGPYTQIGTVSGRATTTFTDTIALLQTQYYVIEATRNNWTSPDSNQAGVHNITLGVCTSA